jgi:signal transduction histidine kinase
VAAEVSGGRRQIPIEIAEALVAEHQLGAMMPRLLSCCVEALRLGDAGIIVLRDRTDGRLSLAGSCGYRPPPASEPPTEAPEPPSPAPDRLPSEARRALVAAETALGGAPGAAGSDDRGAGPPLVCFPLRTAETILGALVLERRAPSPGFTEEEVGLLRGVADLVALSIENRRLANDDLAGQTLSEANRLKAELISTLAHEMRTPLTSIKGYSTALLLEEASFDPETQQEFLRIIDEECDILQDLIRDLLESSVIDAGLLRLELQPVALPHMVESVVADIVRRSADHQLVVDFPPSFPIVDADPERIAQVLRNLLDNAVKYSPSGRLVLIRGQVGEGEVVLSVADQGVGIAPEDLNRLFEKFFRVESGLGRHVVGSGLGLPISRTIVESHGGRIWAESKVGEGSTLYFTLPLGDSEQEDGD